MAYTKTNWQNAPSTVTAVSAENLNHIEQGIADAHAAISAGALAPPVPYLRYSGTSWPTRPAGEQQTWVSTKYPSAPLPPMQTGDMWIRHPDALETL